MWEYFKQPKSYRHIDEASVHCAVISTRRSWSIHYAEVVELKQTWHCRSTRRKEDEQTKVFKLWMSLEITRERIGVELRLLSLGPEDSGSPEPRDCVAGSARRRAKQAEAVSRLVVLTANWRSTLLNLKQCLYSVRYDRGKSKTVAHVCTLHLSLGKPR